MSGGFLAICPPFFLRGVAGPQADRDLGADPAQRRPQVALDVVGERFQRRDVDELDAGPERRARARACRSPRGSWRASCRSRSGRRSARWRRPRSPPSRRPGPASAPRRRPRTSAAPAPENGASGSDFAVRFFAVVNPPILRRRVRRPARSCPYRRHAGIRNSSAGWRLRGAAGELDEFGPGGLRDEAFFEQAGAVAEVAGARLVVDREPVDPFQLPGRRFGAEQGEGAFQLLRLAPQALGEDVQQRVGRRRLRAPAELGDPEALGGVVVGAQDLAEFFDLRRQFRGSCRCRGAARRR